MSDLLLLSGGIDSIAIAAWLRPQLCVTVDYGQRPANAEVQASIQVCRMLGLEHEVVKTPVFELGSGLLAGRPRAGVSNNEEFWPFRNQFLLTVGGMLAVKKGLTRLLLGTVRSDRRHRDGTPEFIELMAAVMRLQEGGVEVVAPALDLTSADLVRASGVREDVLRWAHSCHTEVLACGDCPGCIQQAEVMRKLGYDCDG